MNTFNAPFTQGPKSKTVINFTAIGGIGGGTPTNIVTLATAGVNGGYVTKITATPMGSVTAGCVVLFESANSAAGSLATLTPVDSVVMAAYTQATATAYPVTEFSKITPDNPKRLGPGMSLAIGCEVGQASGIAYHVEWEDL